MTKRGRHLLNANECAKLVKAGTKGRYKDGGSLFLEITAPGQAAWVYRWGANNNPYHIGTWADYSIAEARVEHTRAREWVKQGLNPAQQRKVLKVEASTSSTTTFKGLAEDWLESKRSGWSDIHYRKSRRAIERDVYPTLSSLPVSQITPAMVHKALEPLQNRAPESGARVRQHLGQIFDLGRIQGLRHDNPVVVVSGGSRSTGKVSAKQPALLKLADLGKVLRDTESANTSPVVRMALWLLSRTAVRPGELVPAKWNEFDLDSNDPKWQIPRERMKTQSRALPHSVPLSPAVVAKLRDWQRVSRGSAYVFPTTSAKSTKGHISVESMEKCYRVTLGLRRKHVPHGWRSAFNTNAHDALDKNGRRLFDVDVVEIALDHLIGGKVRQAYDRGERWEARKGLMQWWSDQLDQAERGATVLEFRHVG